MLQLPRNGRIAYRILQRVDNMKIDRLLGILIYLLNREMVSTRILAEKFEVSTRTIQRDIETLSMAGIPVTSMQGTHGGYSIISSYKMSKQVFTDSDYLLIITALRGLCSAYEDRQIEATFEKLVSLSPDMLQDKQSIHLDFSVLREGFYIGEYLSLIEDAIHSKKVVQFEYTDAVHAKSQRRVEPVVLTYKWYAWYLLGFCCDKQDYRMFRLSRIRNLRSTSADFERLHENADQILAQRQDQVCSVNIKLVCSSEISVSIEECFPNACVTEIGDNKLVFEFSVPENERGWFGMLLSFGNKVLVMEPEALKQRLIHHAEQIIEAYR